MNRHSPEAKRSCFESSCRACPRCRYGRTKLAKVGRLILHKARGLLLGWPSLGFLLATMWLLPGCGTPKPSAQGTGKAIFYPKPPDPPKLQFLTSFNTSADLEGGPGKMTTFLTGQTVSSNMIFKPYGLAFHRGSLYICDTIVSAIQVLDFNKRQMRAIQPPDEGKLRTPINMAIDTDGVRYVADTGRNQVLIYGADESYVGAIGQPRQAAGAKGPSKEPKFSGHGKAPLQQTEIKPTDVLIGGDKLYVADMQGHCVRVYDKGTKELLSTIPKEPTEEQARLFAPSNLAVDSQGQLYVSDLGAFRVQVYDAEGKHVRTVGGPGDAPGEFSRPKGIAVDREGRLYVVDAAFQNVQMFDKEGQLLLHFGEPGGNPVPLDLPAKVIVDYEHISLFQRYVAPNFVLEHLVIVSNQMGDRKISVYGFGHKK
jgi:sugar lactone lactonase YvrE